MRGEGCGRGGSSPHHHPWMTSSRTCASLCVSFFFQTFCGTNRGKCIFLNKKLAHSISFLMLPFVPCKVNFPYPNKIAGFSPINTIQKRGKRCPFFSNSFWGYSYFFALWWKPGVNTVRFPWRISNIRLYNFLSQTGGNAALFPRIFQHLTLQHLCCTRFLLEIWFGIRLTHFVLQAGGVLPIFLQDSKCLSKRGESAVHLSRKVWSTLEFKNFALQTRGDAARIYLKHYFTNFVLQTGG